MDKIDLALEVIEMDKFYEQNEDFRHFVDKCRNSYGWKMTDAFESPITREYYHSKIKGGCNAKSKN